MTSDTGIKNIGESEAIVVRHHDAPLQLLAADEYGRPPEQNHVRHDWTRKDG
jgi:hypothetical protein